LCRSFWPQHRELPKAARRPEPCRQLISCNKEERDAACDRHHGHNDASDIGRHAQPDKKKRRRGQKGKQAAERKDDGNRGQADRGNKLRRGLPEFRVGVEGGISSI
jgi:hypothetical protein